MRLASICASLAVAALGPGLARAADLGFSLYGGYQGGVGGRLVATVGDLFPGVPLAVSAGVGYALRDPGDPALARAVFVNQNTNGTPEESGHAWDARLDFVWLFGVPGLVDAGLFGGVRRTWFTGEFRYVGGNEDFEVRSQQWGWGLGLRGALAIGRAWSLSGSLGFDHYPAWSVTGHDATYRSDGSSVNARNDGAGYTYTSRDADQAVNQPEFVPFVLLGVTWRPGAIDPATTSAPKPAPRRGR
jgi:hypothetical protein